VILEQEVRDSQPQSEFLGEEFRLLDRYELQAELVETLKKTERHSHLAPKVAACHHTFRGWHCNTGGHNFAMAENSCSVRVCPHDSRRRSLVLAARLEKFVIGKTGLRYAVLAESNSADLAEGLVSLWSSWTRLRRSVCWKRKVRGCTVALEVTYNREENSWHPHLNVLMEGEYFPFEELNQAWIEATEGRGRTSFIRAADAGTVRELIKYVTKISDLLGEAPALDEFLTAVFRKRLVRTYGSFYDVPVDDEENPRAECPDCHSHDISRMGIVPSYQVCLDLNGVFRVKRSQRDVDRDLQNAVEFYPAFLMDGREVSRRAHPRAHDREFEQFKKFVRVYAATSRTRSSNGNSTSNTDPRPA
jgi:replication protein